MDEPLQRVVAEVMASKRYAATDEAIVRRIAGDALRRSSGHKDAVKRAKRALHQAVGSFLPAQRRWDRVLSALEQGDRSDETLHAVLRTHASTRERLPHMAELYEALQPWLSGASRVADVGCGLHPLARRWMGLGDHVAYAAYDADAAMMDAVRRGCAALGHAVDTRVWDAIRPPAEGADLLFALKLLPTLERQGVEPGEWLGSVAAPVIVVSFPTRTLGGRNVGMASSYGERFEALVGDRGWRCDLFAVPSERVYVVTR